IGALLASSPQGESAMYTAILFALLATAAILAARLSWIWFRSAGDRLVTCPETRQPVGGTVGTTHAAWTGIAHAPALRLSTCTRWPERKHCGQECLAQIAASPEGCLVSQILAGWYAGKSCAICGKLIGEIRWSDHRPALLNPERHTVDWTQVRT